MNLRFPALAGAFVLATAVAASALTPTQFKLAAQNNSGETATATLLDGVAGLIVKIRTNGGSDEAQPAHIHRGTCAKLDPKPVYPLTSVVNGQSETHVAAATVAQLTKGDYAINIHKSAKEIATYVACGDLKVTAAAPAAAPAAPAAPAAAPPALPATPGSAPSKAPAAPGPAAPAATPVTAPATPRPAPPAGPATAPSATPAK